MDTQYNDTRLTKTEIWEKKTSKMLMHVLNHQDMGNIDANVELMKRALAEWNEIEPTDAMTELCEHTLKLLHETLSGHSLLQREMLNFL